MGRSHPQREAANQLAKKYSNMDNINNDHSFLDVIKWMRNRPKKILQLYLQQHGNKRPQYLKANRTEETITWIGHSTFLIQKEGLNVVTDPVWAKRMGTSKRLTEPGLAMKDMPEVDVILISHAHYDHLDIASLRALGGTPTVLVPEGLGLMIKGKGFSRVIELPWWEMTKVGSLEFHFVPAQHWTRRTLWDTNSSHWGGWIIKKEGANEESIYFAGDSGFFRGFKEIGSRYNIHTAILPIGAYDPVWFMHISHMTPEEAVQAFLDIQAQVFIPMHYGTFMLADDTSEEALQRLKQEWEKQALSSEQLKPLELGQTLINRYLK
jgi:L-ascorbate metabolism protein UlaG (beta-lactamase superfamily)